MRTERPSERKGAANQANARKPRGRWAGTPERAALDEAKRLLREAIPEGAAHLAALIRGRDTPPELRLQAFKLAADRVGLPVLTQSEVQLQQGLPRVKLIMGVCEECGREHEDLADALGWPKPGDDAGAVPATSQS